MRAAVGSELVIAHVTVSDTDTSPVNRQVECRLQQRSGRRRRGDVVVDGTAVPRSPTFRLVSADDVLPTGNNVEYRLIFVRPPSTVVDSMSVVIECTDGDRQPVKRQLSIVIETNEVRQLLYLLIYPTAAIFKVYWCYFTIIFFFKSITIL
jgi:hypothetical protein